MMPNIVDGGDMGGLMRYLVGPGRANEHTEPHLVAGSRTIIKRWGDWSELSTAQAGEIARYLDSFMNETDRTSRGPIRKFDPAAGRTQVTDYGANHVWHCSLSLSPDEGPLSEEKWAAIARDFMDQMEFTSACGKSECRWVAIHHGASKNGGDHIHIAANIIREDGTKWNNWNDQPRSQRACNALEHKYGLRIVEGREHNRSSKCDSAQALNAARRAGKPVTDRAALETRLRAAAKAASNEVEFIGRARGLGVRLRPRFAKGHTDVIVGYSAALHTKPGQRTQWYAGGSIARDLTLSALRERWPDTIDASTDAVRAWHDAWKGMPLGAHRSAYTPEEWQGYRRALEIYRDELGGIDPADPLALANATNDVAGLLAAAAQQSDLSEDMRRALDYSARQVGRNAQLKQRPVTGSGTSPWVVLGARLLSTAITPKTSKVNYALMLVEALELVKTLANLYEQARQTNTAHMILRDTRTVYDRLRAEAPHTAHQSLQVDTATLQQDVLPEPAATRSAPSVQEESVTVGAPSNGDYFERLRARHKFLALPDGFGTPTEGSSTSGNETDHDERTSRRPLPGIGQTPQLTKLNHPTHHPTPRGRTPERGRGQLR